MKKILLSAIALVAMTLSASAESKTVTFDFTAQGYSNAQDFDGQTTNLGEGVTVAWSKGTGTVTPKYYNTGTAMRLYGGNTATFAVDGKITSIVFTYSSTYVATAENTSVSAGTFDYATNTWSGSAKQVVLSYVATSGHLRIMNVAVTYEVSGGDTPTPSGDAESFVFATWDATNSVCVPNSILTIPTANTAADTLDGSYMKMNQIAASTANMDVVFTSGPISQSVKVNETADPTATDPGFAIFYQNFYKLDKKNDFGNKDGQLEPIAFVQGYGNPCAAQTHTPYYNEEKSKWAVTQVFTYYQPDGSAGLPTNGSYLEFTPKKDGQLTARVYVLKGSRPFYIVDKETKCALDTTQYSAWGCANGQKTADGTCLRYEQLSHGNVPVTSEAGDTIGWKPNYCLWFTGQKANQNLVADVTFNVTAGKTYMMFCGNTQIGISSYTFVPVGGTGIETVSVAAPKADPRMFNLSGQLVDESYKGVVIQNGKKYMRK